MEEYNIEYLSDPHIFEINKLKSVSNHKFYSSISNYKKSFTKDLYLDLNGVWKFDWVKNLKELNTEKYLNNDLELGSFDNIYVPGHIQLQGYDRIHYTNTIYPWDGHEDVVAPNIPTNYNPVGIYIKDINLDKNKLKFPINIQFNGVELAFYLFVNGKFVGYAEDGFTASRFDISNYVQKGRNRIVVQVHKFSSGAWLEDQDFWRFSGIFRDVFIYSTPITHLEDLYVYHDLSDNFKTAHVTIKSEFIGNLNKKHLKIKLIDIESREIIHESENYVIKEITTIEFNVYNPKLWSSEFPNLYELYIEVQDKNNILEVVSQTFGFREFKMDNGIMEINGERLVFKGVNRHEFNYRYGRVVSEEDMLWDIKFLKKNNFNAVRTAHYPNLQRWYDLCDIYGIYVMDEANLESHGTWQKLGYIDGSEHIPGNLPEWHGAVMDRGESMFEQHKNHPSILMWSVGNESFAGTNLLSMADFFRKKDPRRLVHYEGVFHNRDYNQISDLESRMYAKVAEIEEYLDNSPTKPFINCEYAHAMGNSLGNLNHYSNLEDKYKMYQGGFIWDYIDQGLEISKNGEHYLAYGGDFGDRPTDYNFCINGIVYANRKPSPKVQEVRKAFEFVKLILTTEGVLIKNRHNFNDLSDHMLFLRVLEEGIAVSSEVFSIKVTPGEDYILDYEWPQIRTNKEIILEAQLLLGFNNNWANESHILSWGQKTLKDYQYVDDDLSSDYKLVEGDGNIGVKTDSLKMMFHRSRGLVSLRIKGNEIIKSDPVRPVFYRPSIDNDDGSDYNYETSSWLGASLFSEINKCEVIENEESVKVLFTYSLFENTDTSVKITYEIINDGLNIHYKYVPGNKTGELSMHGLMFKLANDYEFVEYYGKGPDENYIDRNKGAKIGKFKYDVKDNLSKYSKPQASGNRTGTRYLKLKKRHHEQSNVTISSLDKPFEFSALPYSFLEIQQARHPFELEKSSYTHLTVSGIERGVGGDDSWGAPTLKEYRVNAEDAYKFSIRITNR